MNTENKDVPTLKKACHPYFDKLNNHVRQKEKSLKSSNNQVLTLKRVLNLNEY